jgi:hypothetical protein
MEMSSAVLPNYNLIGLIDDNDHGGSWVIRDTLLLLPCYVCRLEVGEWDEVLTAPIQYGPGLF